MRSLTLVTVLCLVAAAAAANDQPPVRVDLPAGGDSGDAPLSGDVSSSSESWGYKDQTAYAGKLFEYRLRTDGAGDINQVSETGSQQLPPWLHYDAEKGLLEGVPTSDDIGKTFQIEVTLTEADGDDTNDVIDIERRKTTVADSFEIRVVDETATTGGDAHLDLKSSSGDSEAPRPIRCLPGSAVTTATVVVDADLTAMSIAERASVLRAFADHLELLVGGLRLTAASGSAPIDDGSALVAGVGNVPATSADEGGARMMIQWEVGCGNVFAAHMSVLHRVETSALDGSMAATIGRGIVGWHVANKKPVSATRLRRQATRLRPTATPTVSVTPPTRRPVPTTTVKEPEPTIVATPSARPTMKPPKTRPTTTSRPTRPPKTTRERTQRPTTSRTTTTTTVKPLTRASDGDKLLLPSVAVGPTTSRQADVPTPPLVITKAGTTMYPPLEWTGNFNKIAVSVNEIVNQKLPRDAFTGGAPGDMTVELLTEDGLSASMSWLKLNQTSRHLYGMPMEIHKGSREYVIRASDRTGSSAQGSFVAEVNARPQVARPAYESSATLDLDYDAFCENDLLRLDVANKIAGAFGDPDARNLAITRVARGSVVLAWTNSTMSGDEECRDDEMNAIQSRMFNEDGTIRDSFQEAIKPYTILGVEMAKRGSCGTESVRATPGVAPVIARTESVPFATTAVDPGSQPKTAAAGSSTTVIIVVLIVVAVVILVIIAVACVCCRRNRKKSESPDKKIKPGAPIILAYELDNMDASMTPSKPLIGAGNERPPAPPNYQLATGANGATPPTDHRRPLLASDAGAEQMSPLKYQPPPGSASSRGQQPTKRVP